MKLKKVDVLYFSGTGNTLLVVQEMCRVFENLAVSCKVQSMVNSAPESIGTDSTLGLAFPVACFTTYPLVWDFVRRLPDGNGREVFMVATMGQFSGALSGQMRSLLVRRGYSPIGAKAIPMPNNIVFSQYDEEKNREKREVGMQIAKQFAHDLVYGNCKWKKLPLIAQIVNSLKLEKLVWKMMRKKLNLTVDNIKCIRCGICYKLCPVENIEMPEYPEFQDKCQFCLRCISYCPTQAIRFKEKSGFQPYTAIDYEELLK